MSKDRVRADDSSSDLVSDGTAVVVEEEALRQLKHAGRLRQENAELRKALEADHVHP